MPTDPTTTTAACFRCKGELPRACHVYAMIDGVQVPFCSEEHMRATLAEMPPDPTEAGVVITPRWGPTP